MVLVDYEVMDFAIGFYAYLDLSKGYLIIRESINIYVVGYAFYICPVLGYKLYLCPYWFRHVS